MLASMCLASETGSRTLSLMSTSPLREPRLMADIPNAAQEGSLGRQLIEIALFSAKAPIIRQNWTDLSQHHNDRHQLDDDGKCAHLSKSKPTGYWILQQSMHDLL